MTKSSKSTIAIPEFASVASGILRATAKCDKAAIKASTAVSALMAAWIDRIHASGAPKDEATCRALRAAILDARPVVDSIAIGTMEQKTWGNYAQGAARAFVHGVAWSARAFQAPEKGGLPPLPWSKGAKAAASGVVRTTDKKAVFTTARKLIEQLRLLKLDAQGAGIVDVILEEFPDFTESE